MNYMRVELLRIIGIMRFMLSRRKISRFGLVWGIREGGVCFKSFLIEGVILSECACDCDFICYYLFNVISIHGDYDDDHGDCVHDGDDVNDYGVNGHVNANGHDDVNAHDDDDF